MAKQKKHLFLERGEVLLLALCAQVEGEYALQRALDICAKGTIDMPLFERSIFARVRAIDIRASRERILMDNVALIDL